MVTSINSAVYSRNIFKIPIDDQSLSIPVGFSYQLEGSSVIKNLTALITVYNAVQMNFTTGQEYLHSGTFFCQLAPKAYNVSIKCPHASSVINYNCPGSISGNVFYNCSTYSKVPICIPLTAFNQSSNIVCSLFSFNSTASTCSCFSAFSYKSPVVFKLYTRVNASRTPFVLKFEPNPQFEKQEISITASLGSLCILGVLVIVFGYIYISERNLSLISDAKKYDQTQRRKNLYDNYDFVISSAFPEGVFDKSFHCRFLNYFMVNNPVFGSAVGPEQPKYGKTQRTLLFIGHIVTMASLSVLIVSSTSVNNGLCLIVVLTHIISFDKEIKFCSGTCETFGTSDACLANTYFTNKDYCDWNIEKDFCFYNSSVIKTPVIYFERCAFIFGIMFYLFYYLFSLGLDFLHTLYPSCAYTAHCTT
jgi:hypothetical protein